MCAAFASSLRTKVIMSGKPWQCDQEEETWQIIKWLWTIKTQILCSEKHQLFRIYALLHWNPLGSIEPVSFIQIKARKLHEVEPTVHLTSFFRQYLWLSTECSRATKTTLVWVHILNVSFKRFLTWMGIFTLSSWANAFLRRCLKAKQPDNFSESLTIMQPRPSSEKGSWWFIPKLSLFPHFTQALPPMLDESLIDLWNTSTGIPKSLRLRSKKTTLFF